MVEKIPEGMRAAFERKSHPYYFCESLMSTPQGLKKVLEPAAYQQIVEAAKVLRGKKAVYFVGNGTSLFNGISAQHMMNLHTTILSITFPAFEFLCYPPNKLDGECAVIGISHSGNSPETVNAVRMAKEKGATIIAITDNEKSQLSELSDYLITSENEENQGPKNRSYVASVLRGHLLALEYAKLENKDVEQVLAAYKEAPGIAESILAENEEVIKKFAVSKAEDELNRIAIVGSGFQYANACEGALKASEAALLYCDYWELEEGLHGPWYNMQPNELLVVNAITGKTYEKSKLWVRGIKEISSNTWAITNTKDNFDGADFVTRLPEGLPESMYGLFTILPIYMFIYYYAVALGKNSPDHGPYSSQMFMDARWILRKIKK